MASVQLNVDDTSPTISYFPFADTLTTPNLTAGWNPYFTSSGFNTFPGQIGQGTSQHITSLDNASLLLIWQGTGIELLGNVTNDASFSLLIDGLSIDYKPQPKPNVLVNIANLGNTNHTLSLTAKIPAGEGDPPNSMLVFDGAILTAPPPTNSSDSFPLRALNDSTINFRGQWSFHEENNQRFRQSNTAGDSAQSFFLGTTFVINGTTSPESGNYTVKVDNTTRVFSAKSSFTQNDSLLFFATGLDPTVQHDWEIRNEGGSLIIPVEGFAAFSDGDPSTPPPPASPPPPTSGAMSSYSKGTIAALALAGVLAFLLLTGILVFFLFLRPRHRRIRRKRRERRRKAQEAGMVLDIAPGKGDMPPSRRTSRFTGFARWKHEVEGGALGLSDIGISFRRSDEKLDTEDEEEDPDVPRSARSFRFTPSPRQRGKSRWMGGRRGRDKRGSSSPSVALDLPPLSHHSQSHSGSRSAGQDASSGLSSLSYLSSPSFAAAAIPVTFSRPQPPSSRSPQPNPDLLYPYGRPRDHDGRSAYTSESDYGSVREYDDGMSVLGPATAQAAIRSLSPRTSEVDSRSGSRSDAPSPHYEWPSQRQPEEHRRDQGRADNFLDVRASSPSGAQPRPTRLSSLSHVRFEDIQTAGKSDKDKGRKAEELQAPQKAVFRLTPQASIIMSTDPNGARSRVTSFLDFGAGSSDASVTGGHSQNSTQSSNGSIIQQPKSRWSSTTVPSSMNQEALTRANNSSDSQSQSQSFLSIQNSSPSSTFPFPVSLPASPHHPEGHRASPPSDPHSLSEPALHAHPLETLESPTESVPISITDLHFRHSDSEDTDPNNGSHLPRHPPLPALESTLEEDDSLTTPTFVVSHVLGRATSSSAFYSTRLTSPTTPRARIPDSRPRQDQSDS